jgi:cation diffusion facilitator CzcD-associated flavoprotein CzcO
LSRRTELQTETLVIGAGPAGLAAGACLTRRGAPFVIVEQSTAVGASWRGHYDRIHLHTDRRNSALPFLGFPPGTARYPSRKEVIDYLERYANHFQLTPRLQERVDNVRSEGGAWVTTTSARIYRSRNVIVASGFNSVPHMPRWAGRERFRGRILHSSEYRNGEPFRGQNVLVVGFGNSAGEIAVDLHEHGARVAMAVRGPVNIVPRDILGLSILTVSIALSPLPARLADVMVAPLLRIVVGDISRLGFRRAADGPVTQIRERSRVPLVDVGTVRLVREGHIEVLRGIHSLSDNTVTFDDGSPRDFDAIIAATGFRPGVERFLESHSFSPRVERSHEASAAGLYFCGFSVTPTGMFREIGIEARRIAHRISTAPHPQG